MPRLQKFPLILTLTLLTPLVLPMAAGKMRPRHKITSEDISTTVTLPEAAIPVPAPPEALSESLPESLPAPLSLEDVATVPTRPFWDWQLFPPAPLQTSSELMDISVLAQSSHRVLLSEEVLRRGPASVSPQEASPLFPELKLSSAALAKLESYRLAIAKSSQESCEDLYALAIDNEFSRRDLAHLRLEILCPALLQAKPLSGTDIAIPSFLKELNAEAKMVLAERSERWSDYLDLLYDKIRNTRPLKEKTKALENGWQLAERMKLPKEAKRFRAELERLAPRFIKKPTLENYLSVGQDWILVREFDKGRSYLNKVLKAKKVDFAVQRKAFQSLRNSYKTEQDKVHHMEESEKYYQWLVKKKEFTAAFEAGFYWARALWTEGQKSKAQDLMLEMEKKLQGAARTYEMDFVRGRMAEEDSQFIDALAAYDRAIVAINKIPATAAIALQKFKIESARAWVLRQSNRDLEAASEFERIAASATELSDQLKARFWQAKSLSRAGQKEKAEALFRQIAFDDPTGFYGLVAFRELKAEIPPVSQDRKQSLKGWNTLPLALAAPPEAKTNPAPTEKNTTANSTPKGVTAASFAGGIDSTQSEVPLAQTGGTLTVAPVAKVIRALNDEEKAWITDLFLMGEKQILQKYLDHLAADKTWNYATSEGLQLLKAYARSGLYLPLFATIGKIEKTTREELLLSHPELLFPVDYEDLIGAAASAEGIPKELVFSIIRQESAFDPNARSFADAMGLMQVLPSLAKNVAKTLALTWTGHDDLFRPEVNVPVGARMLRQSLERYQGNFILAIASYNANDKAIRGWLKTRFRDDPVEFIEEIAYDETRNYVKLVLRNYIFYKRLARANQSLIFPPECLPNLHPFQSSHLQRLGEEPVSVSARQNFDKKSE